MCVRVRLSFSLFLCRRLFLFGVGLHFNLDNLLSVRKTPVIGVLLQTLVIIGCSVGLGMHFALPLIESILLGIGLSAASTLVTTKLQAATGLKQGRAAAVINFCAASRQFDGVQKRDTLRPGRENGIPRGNFLDLHKQVPGQQVIRGHIKSEA